MRIDLSRRFGGSATLLLACLILPWILAGCSVKKTAVRTLSKALVSGDENVFATDNDPVLISQALPFALKTLEALLQQDPENIELQLTTCSSYTQYTYAFVELEAEKVRLDDHRAARQIRERAVNLYLRARDFCLNALELKVPGTREALLRDTSKALAPFGPEDVGVLYWTAGSWGSAISNGRHRSELLIDLDLVRAILERTLELDEDYGRGVLHDAMVSLESLPAAMGGSYERAMFHYERALELNSGQRVSSYLNWAWLVNIGRQERDEFESTLAKALAIKIEEGEAADRLANRVNQDFARSLRDRADELFLDDDFEEEEWDEDFEDEDP